MTVLYDTSALIGLFIEEHPTFERAVSNYLDLMNEGTTFFMCAHSLAEFYNNVTRGRGYLDLTPKQALNVISRIKENFHTVGLNEYDYLAVIRYLEKQKLTGAIIYDGLVVRSSQKIGAKYITTGDEGDFMELAGLTGADFIVIKP